MSEYFTYGQKIFVPDVPAQLWIGRHKDDPEVHGWMWQAERGCQPCPAVWPLLPNSDHRVELTEQWQYYIRAINYGMSLQYVANLIGPEKAFTNWKVGEERADWLRKRNLDQPNPTQDRVRSCSRAPISGIVNGDNLFVSMMNGNNAPRIKEGYKYPRMVEEINPDAYVYMPRTHPEKFLVATIVNAEGRTRPFPNGVVYDWKGDNQPYVFWPYISKRDIIYPLSYLVQGPITSPYT